MPNSQFAIATDANGGDGWKLPDFNATLVYVKRERRLPEVVETLKSPR